MSQVAETATLVHGYTMADLERAARISSWKAPARDLPQRDRYDTAWSAMAELLYSSNTPPTFHDLLDAGRNAIVRESKKHWHHHGWDSQTREPSPSFQTYWGATISRHGNRWPGDFTDSTLERIALPQVLALLDDRQYQVISALAVHGTNAAAAKAIGMHVATFGLHLREARRRVLEAWLAPDRPPARADDECKAGHSRSEHSYKNKHGYWVCRTCDRNANRRKKARGYVSPTAKLRRVRSRDLKIRKNAAGKTVDAIAKEAALSFPDAGVRLADDVLAGYAQAVMEGKPFDFAAPEVGLGLQVAGDNTERDRAIRSLRSEGLSYHRIAEKVGCSVATAYVVVNPRAT